MVLGKPGKQPWENFLIAERMKVLKNQRSANQGWFWRTHQQQEIDYIEERSTGLFATEITWRSGRGKTPTTFIKAYPEADTQSVSPDNWRELVYADV